MADTEKPLLHVYLFSGDDNLKKETLLERLTSRIAKQGDLMMNSVTFTSQTLKEPQVLIDALDTLPFGAPLRLVVIKDIDSVGKPVQEALISYMARPNETTVLVMTATKLASNTRLHKAILAYNKQAILDCGAKKRWELPTLIRSMAKGCGTEISTASANYLIEHVGTSTVALNNEVKKLSAYVQAFGRGEIREDDIERTVAQTAEPEPWKLPDALCERDLVRTLQVLDRLGSRSAPYLFMLCIGRLRDILSVAVLQARGSSDVAGAMKKPSWMIEPLLRGASNYSLGELEGALKAAPQREKQMKSGSDADHLLRLWLVDLCKTD